VKRTAAPFLFGVFLAAAALAVPGAADEPLHRTLTHADLEAKYADAESHFAVIDDVRLHYKDEGQGPAILLVHGSLGDVGDWDGWTRVLAPHFRVVRLDLPGFGLSGEIANGNYSIDRSLTLIDGLMDSLGLERFAIAGVSYGGPVAFRYAATRTERVSALIIMNSAGIEFGKQTVDPKSGKKSFYGAVTSDAPLTREFIERSYGHAFNDPAHLSPQLVQRKLDLMNVIGREREGAFMISEYVRGDPDRVLAHVRAPTLVLWGGAERSLSPETADHFVAALTHARVVKKVVIPRGDHAMHIEFPLETATAAREFLEAHPDTEDRKTAAAAMALPMVSPATMPVVFPPARYSVAAGAGGVPLNVVEAGDPKLPAILFIHGFRQSSLSWIDQFGSELATRCHLVAFDLRGHGNSGVPWNADAYDRSAVWGEDVANVIRATRLSKPLIVGWSYGGNVAMDFARHYPTVPVAGLVLVSSAAGMFAAPPAPPHAPVRPTSSPDLSTNIAGVAASGAIVFPATLDPALRQLFDAAAMRVSPFVDRALARRVAGSNTDLIPKLHAPVTLVFGGRDPIVAPAVQARLRALFPNARVVDFPEAGHALFLEDAARFNELLGSMQCSESR
jgi:pimeloyl-ACP methyl ester carboxylesterase